MLTPSTRIAQTGGPTPTVPASWMRVPAGGAPGARVVVMANASGRARNRHRRFRRQVVLAEVAALVLLLLPVVLLNAARAEAAGPCGPPVTSVIACENTLPGDPASDWQVTGAGDATHPGLRDRR